MGVRSVPFLILFFWRGRTRDEDELKGEYAGLGRRVGKAKRRRREGGVGRKGGIGGLGDLREVGGRMRIMGEGEGYE